MASSGEISSSLSHDTQLFLQKAARSVAEVQPNVNNIGDTLVFLEVLGYNNEMVEEHCFTDLYDFAKNVYADVEYYNEEKSSAKQPSVPVSSITKRTIEALGMAFPWIGSWAVLLVFGISLWLARKLPLGVTTAFLVGVFLGLLISGGQTQAFTRLFSFYNTQSNLSETRRILRRDYSLLGLLLITASAFLFIAGQIENVPLRLVEISIVGTVTISLHLTSYMILYSLKKFRQIILFYSAALGILLVAYYGLAGIVVDPVLRYFVGLGAALALLSVTSVYYHYKILHPKALLGSTTDVPPFFSPVFTSERTISSRFSVQLWEMIPYYVYGMFFFAMLFGDRMLSWIFNPIKSIDSTTLPMVFNPVYHLGADLALLVLFPATVIEYVYMTTIFEELHNFALGHRVTESDKIDVLLRARYKKILSLSIIASSILATSLIIFAARFISYLGGEQLSVNIFYVAAVSNIFLAAFSVNAVFLIFMNKIRTLCGISIVSVLNLGCIGLVLAQYGFQYIIISYAVATLLATFLSFRAVWRNLDKIGRIHLARYV